MIVATIINFANSFGKGGNKKPVGPLEVMGYTEEEGSSTQKPQSQMEMALRMRLLSAFSKKREKGK